MVFHAFVLKCHFFCVEMLKFSWFGENVRKKIMYEAQVYYNTHTVKKWYFKYIFLRI